MSGSGVGSGSNSAGGVGSSASYDGSSLSSTERAGMLFITCYDTMEDNEEFGPRFSGLNPNLSSFIVKCPTGCEDTTTANVYG